MESDSGSLTVKIRAGAQNQLQFARFVSQEFVPLLKNYLIFRANVLNIPAPTFGSFYFGVHHDAKIDNMFSTQVDQAFFGFPYEENSPWNSIARYMDTGIEPDKFGQW